MRLRRRHPDPRSRIALAFGLAAALAVGCAAYGMPMPQGIAISRYGPLLKLVQAPGADSARVAVAGERLSVRAAPRGNSPVVARVEKGDEVIVVETQAPWAKIEDHQSGRVLGWVYESLLVGPAG